MRSGKRGRRAVRWLSVLPAIVLILAIMVFPILYNFYISLRYVTLVNLRTGGRFIGLQNYVSLFGEASFWASMGTTLRYVVVTVALQVLLAFLLGLATYRGRRRLRYATTVCLLLPKMITPAASALIWRFMLNYETGVVNYFLSRLGVSKVAFLTDSASAMPTLSVIGVWQNIGFSYLLLLAGMMAMPYEMIEASLVDGARFGTRLRYILLPALRPVLTVVLLFAIINAFQTFDAIYMTTGGGPGEVTQVASIYLYRKLFISSQMGEAAAISVVLLLISFAISLVLVKVMKRGEEQ
ncbi:carbohydrate ABC transporter permease [Harryflintia acetispora]|uniref:carbohydrate ABC transporter permease n=1 Tax=Harryflintia acetispora TaxID=1849041 RepID=UPI00189893BC|nr:sugar ABC transporter permease [Harryflintia acetispora]